MLYNQSGGVMKKTILCGFYLLTMLYRLCAALWKNILWSSSTVSYAVKLGRQRDGKTIYEIPLL
jgi:hypothetical protein